MGAVYLPFFRPREGGIGLQENSLELRYPRGERAFRHHAPRLPERIGANDKEARPRSFSLYRLPPSGIGLLLRKVDMEAPHDVPVTHQGPKAQPQLLPALPRGNHVKEKALVPGSDIQRLPEAVEILDDRSLLRSPRSKALRNLLHGPNDSLVPGSPAPARPAGSPSPPQALRRTPSGSGQPGVPVGGQETKRGVFKAPVEKRPHHLLVFLALIGLQPHAHEGP